MTISLSQEKLDELESEVIQQEALVLDLTQKLDDAITALTEITIQSKKLRRMFAVRADAANPRGKVDDKVWPRFLQ